MCSQRYVYVHHKTKKVLVEEEDSSDSNENVPRKKKHKTVFADNESEFSDKGSEKLAYFTTSEDEADDQLMLTDEMQEVAGGDGGGQSMSIDEMQEVTENKNYQQAQSTVSQFPVLKMRQGRIKENSVLPYYFANTPHWFYPPRLVELLEKDKVYFMKINKIYKDEKSQKFTQNAKPLCMFSKTKST
ncbi:hypothetical protein DMENIID0001_147250 [Sergentomyia squamirostris]